MPIKYGYHTYSADCLCCDPLVGSKNSLHYCKIAALIGFTCYLALESAVLPLTMQIMGLNMEKLFIQQHFRILAFVPQAIIFLVLLLIIKKKDIVLLHTVNTSKSKVDHHEH
jgi:hypothetical protein